MITGFGVETQEKTKRSRMAHSAFFVLGVIEEVHDEVFWKNTNDSLGFLFSYRVLSHRIFVNFFLSHQILEH